MSDILRSVGLDVGTTSTQMIFSELTVENKASGFAVPEMEIARRDIRYRSPVYFTPLLDESHVDAGALRELVAEEYRKAGIRRESVDTGAIIITGETSRKENARAVLDALSDFAGEFVVATAGPDLESVLAAKGAGAVDYSQRTGKTVLHMDIGGGTTDIAVLSMNGVAVSSSLKVAGNYFDEMIPRYVRRQHGVVVGQVTAENVKIQIGQVYPRDEERSMNVKGRDFKTGMPKVITLTSTEIFEVLRRPARMITDEVLAVLEQTSPELVSDISENGITLTGGCSQIWGMDLLIAERTGIGCVLADDPDACTAYGAGKSLAWINHMQEGPINIARKRAMRG